MRGLRMIGGGVPRPLWMWVRLGGVVGVDAALDSRDAMRRRLECDRLRDARAARAGARRRDTPQSPAVLSGSALTGE